MKTSKYIPLIVFLVLSPLLHSEDANLRSMAENRILADYGVKSAQDIDPKKGPGAYFKNLLLSWEPTLNKSPAQLTDDRLVKKLHAALRDYAGIERMNYEYSKSELEFPAYMAWAFVETKDRKIENAVYREHLNWIRYYVGSPKLHSSINDKLAAEGVLQLVSGELSGCIDEAFFNTILNSSAVIASGGKREYLIEVLKTSFRRGASINPQAFLESLRFNGVVPSVGSDLGDLVKLGNSDSDISGYNKTLAEVVRLCDIDYDFAGEGGHPGVIMRNRLTKILEMARVMTELNNRAQAKP